MQALCIVNYCLRTALEYWTSWRRVDGGLWKPGSKAWGQTELLVCPLRRSHKSLITGSWSRALNSGALWRWYAIKHHPRKHKHVAFPELYETASCATLIARLSIRTEWSWRWVEEGNLKFDSQVVNQLWNVWYKWFNRREHCQPYEIDAPGENFAFRVFRRPWLNDIRLATCVWIFRAEGHVFRWSFTVYFFYPEILLEQTNKRFITKLVQQNQQCREKYKP